MKLKTCSAYYELIIKTLIFMTLIATAISFFGIFITYLNLNYTARRVVREIEISGQVTQNTTDLFNQMKENTNIGAGAIMAVNADYYKDKKIQLRNNFTLICSSTYRINIFTPLENKPIGFDIPMKVKLTGMSERYWK